MMKSIAIMLVISFMAVTGAIAGDLTVSGTVEKVGEPGKESIVIKADDGATYNVMGADLTDMVGKTVTATGTMAEGAAGKILTVVSVEPKK